MKYSKLFTLSLIAIGTSLTSCKKDNDKEEEEKVSSACSMVISNTDGPQVGSSFISLQATFENVNIDSLTNLSGDDKTWDFSNLVSKQDGDSLLFEGPSTIPNGINADMAINGNESLYFNSTSTGLDVVNADFDSDYDLEFEFTNSISIIPYSLERKKVIMDEYALEAFVKDTLDTLETAFGTLYDTPIEVDIVQTNSNKFTVDGCGTIITPKGEFEGLRYKVEPNDPDFDVTVWAEISGIKSNVTTLAQPYIDDYTEGEDINMFDGKTYVWITKEHGYPLVQVIYDENDAIKSVEFLE